MIRPPRLRPAVSVWRRDLQVFSKLWKTTLLPPFLDPFVYFVALGFGLGAYVGTIDGIPYRDFVAPGLCASAVLWGSSFETTFHFFYKMDHEHSHDNILSTPVEPEDLVLGALLWGATRAVLYATAFLIVIAGMGYVDSGWALLLPPFLFLGGLAFGAFGLAYTVLISKMDYFTYYFTLVVNPMFLFGGIFFPFDSLPQWAQTLGWFVPTHHLVELVRAMTTGGEATTVLTSAVWLMFATALLLLVPLRQYRRRMVA
jgi:lipooligosaccharide transport system permease protein